MEELTCTKKCKTEELDENGNKKLAVLKLINNRTLICQVCGRRSKIKRYNLKGAYRTW